MITIRAAKKRDLESVAKIFSIPELAISDGTNLSAQSYEGYLDDNFFLVAEDNDKIVGAIIAEPLKLGLIIHFLGVAKDLRSKGVGSRLLEKVEVNAKGSKKKWTILYAPTFNENTQAFYQAKGYTKGKEHIEYSKRL